MTKKILVAVLATAVMLIGASAAMAKIAGSKHDLSSLTGATHSACAYCHTPHNGGTDAPLWSRTTPTTTGYQLYTTNDGFPVGTPGIRSMTCLSCHDGTIGLGSTINFTDTITPAISGDALIGPDLRNDHPVGVEWGRSGNRAGLSTFVPSGTGNNAVDGKAWLVYYNADGKFYVECGSCHDPHSSDYATGGDLSPFLKGSKATICTDCHSNK